ncbi:MAG: chemotaxis protein CheW [Betaproteobacteria bacterium]|nr:chemotaxis protein CheW [Betaproteobacteria bacterium]
MSTGAPARRAKPRAAVDWEGVHRRLETARAAIERVWAPDAGEKKRILSERAQALARPMSQAEAAGESIEVVAFVLASEHYAVESRYVREVHALENLTPLPCTPAFVLGIVNLRGEILPVIDLRKFFDLPEKGLTNLNRVIVLESADMRFGVLADALAGVRRVPLGGMQASLPTLTGVREDYLKGVTAERMVILDAEKLLSDEGIVVREQVAG